MRPTFERRKPFLKQNSFTRNFVCTSTNKCRYCMQAHSIYSCPEFQGLDIIQRKRFISNNKLCSNCLSHETKEKCRSTRKCTICQQQHHTLLHQATAKPAPLNQVASNNRHVNRNQEPQSFFKSQNVTEIQSHLIDQRNTVLLATALVKVRTANGSFELLRALIDPGSQSSFVTESTAQLLSLPRKKIHAKIGGIGGAEAGVANHEIELIIQPRFSSNFLLNVKAMVLNNLTKLLPDSKIQLPIPLDNCLIADPTFNKPGPIDIILGADIYGDIILQGVYKYGNGLIAQETELGWVMLGQTKRNHTGNICSFITNVEIGELLKKFWELEEIPEQATSPDEVESEQHFTNTHCRNSDGTYTVRLPFKKPMQNLGESKKRAAARLLQMEKKFATNKQLEHEYKRFMQEYVDLKHMVPDDTHAAPPANAYYLPHQAVLKNDSTTTKLRVVFDASSKTTSGVSLNDCLLVGPRLQADLPSILLRWRKHQFVFTADIEKMYRQIKVAEEDQHYQKILWRFSPTEPMREYKLTTVTYGTAPAPYLAIRTIHQLAEDEKRSYPLASKILLRDFYVDDVMSGGNNLEEVKQVQQQLLNLLGCGGFSLRKWTSNTRNLLADIPSDKREKGILEISNEETIKTLGVHWSPNLDTFQFKVQVPNVTITKRTLLADIARIFDPLGWLTPITVKAKLLLQELWMNNLGWDDSLPSDILSKWTKYRGELRLLEQITIPRWIQHDPEHHKIELHGFSDASEKAYAAVVFSRITTRTGRVFTYILAAKSKVAPIKSKLTIPKLELCGATLLVRLMQHTRTSLDIKDVPTTLWTDSKICLDWIKASPHKWKTFVANRVSQIQNLSHPGQWRYICTEDNPADCASRGIYPSGLKTHPLWWFGPHWLKYPEHQWPQTPSNPPTLLEVRQPEVTALTTIASATLIERFSRLNRLLRVTSYCNRFIQACKQTISQPSSIALNPEEIQRTRNQIIRMVQKEHFAEEISKLSKGENLPPKNKLAKFNPFIDPNGLLRIGGRLENSILTYEEKHPIILPRNCHYTTLVINDAHTKALHSGTTNTLAYIRRTYWILDGRSAVGKHIGKCIKCIRFKERAVEQQMGNLPSARVIPSRVFLDYAGLDSSYERREEEESSTIKAM